MREQPKDREGGGNKKRTATREQLQDTGGGQHKEDSHKTEKGGNISEQPEEREGGQQKRTATCKTEGGENIKRTGGEGGGAT